MTDRTEAMEHVIHSSMPIDFERRYEMDNLIAQDADLIDMDTKRVAEITQADRDAAGTWINNTPAVEDWCGYEDQRALVQAFARHRMEERAAIVAWLRGPEPYPDGHDIAADIEAGEHLK